MDPQLSRKWRKCRITNGWIPFHHTTPLRDQNYIFCYRTIKSERGHPFNPKQIRLNLFSSEVYTLSYMMIHLNYTAHVLSAHHFRVIARTHELMHKYTRLKDSLQANLDSRTNWNSTKFMAGVTRHWQVDVGLCWCWGHVSKLYVLSEMFWIKKFCSSAVCFQQ